MSADASHPRALVRALALMLLTLLLLPPALMSQALSDSTSPAVIRLWHRLACRIVGLDLHVSGRVHAAGPTLVVANHVSYLDILLLGSRLHAGFIAKSEVSRWPAIGFLARLIGTVFVERKAQSSGRQRDDLQARLASGASLVLFAEGTSSDGRQVLPFKSSLFGALEDDRLASSVTVQPVTIHYAGLKDGAPVSGERRRLYAWYGDMTLLPHLWTVLGLPGVTVRLRWHDPIAPDRWTSRKDLAQVCRGLVADGLTALQAEAGLSGDRAVGALGEKAAEIALGGPLH